jgi:hypothetical protein
MVWKVEIMNATDLAQKRFTCNVSTTNTDVYLNIYHESANQLEDWQLTPSSFQQDGAVCHMSNWDLEEIQFLWG